MSWTWKRILAFFEQQPNLLKGSLHALEKESLRVDKKGQLARTPHPRALGSALTHPYISTDFSEAQLELITPTFSNERGALQFLHKLHHFIHEQNSKEIIWPFSVPCVLPDESDIPLAEYGSSNLGVKKHLYRKGLAHRYGRKMQMLSGVHYNFSFSDPFWEALHQGFGKKEALDSFISESYLHVVRNFLRIGWLNSYLFGATPAIDKTYLHSPQNSLESLDPNTLYGEYATSIRMSQLGYYSRIQVQRPLNFDSLTRYMSDLSYAVSTPYPPFSKYGDDQLNDHFLQIEAEYYSRIRPKPHLSGSESTLEALKKSGIIYLEVRSVDINPFCQVGVELDQLYFLHVFLLYCLFLPSEALAKGEHTVITNNQNKVALLGRKKHLKLKRDGEPVTLKSWGEELLDEMIPIANLLEECYPSRDYVKSLQRQREKIHDPGLTLSAKVLDELKASKLSLQEFGLQLAKNYHASFLKKPDTSHFKQFSASSLQRQEEKEIIDDYQLKGYEHLEISTQMVIREAKRRNILVEVLDDKENLIRLTKGKKQEIIKQASMTTKDSLISYALMENKAITKQILAEHHLPTPIGESYQSLEDALEAVPAKPCVVKPNLTNYGIGISFVKARDKKEYQEALVEAFKHGQEVIVEEFCEGEELRFLVIQNKVVAICQRVPAHVVGDGKDTISQLVKKKNRDVRAYRFCLPIRLGNPEKKLLADQKLSPKSVPKKGKMVFLRKNSNVSTGGESMDVTDSVHPDYCKLALKAAKIVDACFCGVDMIIPDRKKSGKAHIIELNFNPALYLHRYPVKGKKRYVEKCVLDALGFR